LKLVYSNKATALNPKLLYLSPWKPASHSQTGPSRLSMHLPLFLHGLSVQYGPTWHLIKKMNMSQIVSQNQKLLTRTHLN